MPKVLQVIDNNAYFEGFNRVGGHIAHIVGVAEAFLRLGYEVVLCAYDRIPNWDNPSVQYRRLRATPWPLPKLKALSVQYQFTLQIIKAIREEKPDILYLRWSSNQFNALIRAAYPSLAIVVECNTPAEMAANFNQTGILNKWRARLADQGYIRSATLVSSVSDEVREFLLNHHPKLSPERIISNPNGVDLERFRYAQSDVRQHYQIPKSVTLIGWAGNFLAWHGIDILIQAFQMLERSDVYLMIMGTGSEEIERHLHSIAEQSRIPQIVFTGSVPFAKMPAHLSACDILAAPSLASVAHKFHQSPIKLYEYMAVGRAVVATRIGQVAQVIEDGRNGLLCAPGSKEELFSVLERLVDDPSYRDELGCAARLDAEQKHSWEANVRRILEAVNRLDARQP